jgi:hypothetical protein
MSEDAAMTSQQLSLAKFILGPWVCRIQWHAHVDGLIFLAANRFVLGCPAARRPFLPGKQFSPYGPDRELTVSVVWQLLYLAPQRQSRYASAGAWASNHNYSENNPFIVRHPRFVAR